ncbi:hypothetical protein P691DRAFT_761956 [Macrolepiota fuliginosa MF-IS2]|uniref:F-box domain-containing protein n=1 Tax=Macrolepiota fuliginosa MF-IS2 TaxID=1400762 RepID=A0A9P5XAH7_9AGAR|nr:hypothetical protein P691DRAFT_761956 [Macrolepiota fuliginosa MF-IS2]
MAPQSSKSSKRALAVMDSTSRIRVPRRTAAPSTISTPVALKPLSKPGSNVNGSLRPGKIDTNLRSYDRRDPFGALNTLIKLLASLPSRVIAGGGGGCQYKLLAVDEHKLCMHLCGIVEPFFLSSFALDTDPESSLAPVNVLFKRPRVLLARLPTEILDRIASFIECREDLMTFGSTCKRLFEVVFPRHWEYRLVRAKVSMVGVWKHLHERTDLAANVRVVEVLDERSEKRVLVPRVCRKAVGSSTGGCATKRAGTAGAVVGVKAEEVVSATSTEDDSSSSANEDVGGVGLKKVSIHKRQEKYFVAALAKMSGLVQLKWEANHSPISVLDGGDGAVWRTIVEKCGGSLRALEVMDNMVFAPLITDEESEEDENEPRVDKTIRSSMLNLQSISMKATQFSYGAPKEPSVNRIAFILHQCPNIKNLEVIFKPSKTSPNSLPNSNELLLCGRWSHLTSLTLTNLSCFTTSATSAPIPGAPNTPTGQAIPAIIQQNPLETFLMSHPTLESLRIIDIGPSSAQFRRLRTPRRNMLPNLREIHACRDVINMVLRAECDQPRPLEVVSGFKLVGGSSGFTSVGATGNGGGKITGVNAHANINTEFYQNLRKAGGNVKRIEMEGWCDLDDIRTLVWAVPGLTWLNVGKRLRPAGGTNTLSGSSSGIIAGSGGGGGGSVRGQAQAPVTNMVEWAEVLSGLEELTTFHGVKFFYEVSPNALPTPAPTNDLSTSVPTVPSSSSPTPAVTNTTINISNFNTASSAINMTNVNISMTDRSRIRKNDEIASVLAWKCAKLRRVDHWDGTHNVVGKVIVLFRDGYGNGGEGNQKVSVKWDVRRIGRS